MRDVSQTYLDTLCLYYEEEIEGEAYFRALAERFDNPDHKVKLGLLADVERHAATSVAPLIKAYRLSPRAKAKLVASGIADADNTPVDWAALCDDMRRTYPGYVRAFQELERIGPECDQPRLAFLTEHEVAAIKFLEAETTSASESAAPLVAYLAAQPVS